MALRDEAVGIEVALNGVHTTSAKLFGFPRA
jgi:hypothetical protein